MQMQAIADNYSVEEAATFALCAGTDILIYRDMNKAEEALAAINNALKLKNIKNLVILLEINGMMLFYTRSRNYNVINKILCH